MFKRLITLLKMKLYAAKITIDFDENEGYGEDFETEPGYGGFYYKGKFIR